jgi:hypothetical protein
VQTASHVGEVGGADAGSVPAVAEAQRAAEGGVAVAADPEQRARRGDGGNAETRAAQGRERTFEVGRTP